MAFETAYLMGGLLESIDRSQLNYRRLLAIRAAVLALTDAGHLTAFDAAYAALFGDPDRVTFSRFRIEEQERIIKWALCNLVIQQADEQVVALPSYATNQWMIQHHEDKWLTLPENVIDAVLFATEFWGVSNLGGAPVDATDMATGLTLNGFPASGAEAYATRDRANVRGALAYVRLFGTTYQPIANMDELELDLASEAGPQLRVNATRIKDKNILAHLEIRAWYAVARKNLSLALLGGAFNALTQTAWGDSAVDATVAEMAELFVRIGTAQQNANIPHSQVVAFAEMVAHGYIPNATIMLFGYMPSANRINTPGAIWLEPVVAGSERNSDSVAFQMKMFVPEGVTLDLVTAQWDHPDGNALFPRYVNLTDFVAGAGNIGGVVNDEAAGIGFNRISISRAANWVGGAGGTVFTLATLSFEYLDGDGNGRDISRNPYTMPGISSKTNNGFARSTATITFGGFTTAAGATITLKETDGGADTVLTAGTDFDDGATAGTADALAASVAAAINLQSRTFSATVLANAVTVISMADDGADPDDIEFVGATLIADVGGATESFTGGAAGVPLSAFFVVGHRIMSGLKSDGSRNVAFPDQGIPAVA